jgi:hypothetical protein
MNVPDKLTEIGNAEVRKSLEEWAFERVRDESSMFREALRLFVQMVFVANAAAAVSVATIVFENKARSAPLLAAIACFLIGLLSGLVFGMTLMASLHQCRQKYLIEGPMRYFLGQLSHIEFATLHRESAFHRVTMGAAAAIALIAFAAGIALAAYGALRDLSLSG